MPLSHRPQPLAHLRALGRDPRNTPAPRGQNHLSCGDQGQSSPGWTSAPRWQNKNLTLGAWHLSMVSRISEPPVNSAEHIQMGADCCLAYLPPPCP